MEAHLSNLTNLKELSIAKFASRSRPQIGHPYQYWVDSSFQAPIPEAEIAK